jgi:hypothetical protein
VVTSNGRVKTRSRVLPPVAAPDIPALCLELTRLQRQRAVLLKSRIMIVNRLTAIVAGMNGYTEKLDDAERKAKFKEANTLIARVAKGEAKSEYGDIILAHLESTKGLKALEESILDVMETTARQLPVSEIVNHRESRGFAIGGFATIIGETGNLSDYSTVSKLWKRMGCAPWEFNGKTQMGATWRSGKSGKLPADEWEDFGYSPRRRSIMWNTGDCLWKQNFIIEKLPEARKAVGPYRARHLEAKAAIKELHPEYSNGHCHNHGRLLATKLLLKNLWIAWHHGLDAVKYPEPVFVEMVEDEAE